MERRQSLQQMVLEQLESHIKKKKKIQTQTLYFSQKLI